MCQIATACVQGGTVRARTRQLGLGLHSVELQHGRSARRGIGALLLACTLVSGTLASGTLAWSQSETATPANVEWRRVGNSAIEAALPSVATGTISRVWYSPDGGTLYAATIPAGAGAPRIWETSDFESWTRSSLTRLPERLADRMDATPESGAYVVRANGRAGRWYALGRFAYRSDDDGRGWTNLTGYRDQSILGDRLRDIATSPRDSDEIVLAGDFGVWRSMDGGATWSGLNEGLPNLPAVRILGLPNGYRAARVLANNGLELEWLPGERAGWRISSQATLTKEVFLKSQVGNRWSTTITAAVDRNEWIYAGAQDGRLFVSSDRGLNWQTYTFADSGPVRALFVHPRDWRSAIAVTQNRVLRTSNGGQFWDDISAGVGVNDLRGVAVDAASGAIYLASAKGVFYGFTDLQNLTAAPRWQRLAGSPADAAVLDVQLDEAGNQLFVLSEGYGLYATMAPHRLRDLAVVNAADFSSREAAPGGLLSILGGRFETVRTAGLTVPVLGRSDSETQIQVPFEVQGEILSLNLEAAGISRQFGVPLARLSPAIFIDRDGAPLLLDADSGVAVDASNPAKSGARIQILATGLGAVDPPWPSGVAAPGDNASPNGIPKVVAPVAVFVDRDPVSVTRATLAPGYVGFYLIEVQLPKLVNAGPAELYLSVGDKPSNRVTLYLAP